MITVDHIINYLKYFWPRRKTKIGLLLLIILNFIIFFFVQPFKDINLFLKIIILSILFIVELFFWLFDSGHFLLPSEKIKIALSFKSLDPKTQLIINKMLSLVKDKLNEINLLENIKLYHVSSDLFVSNQQAEKYLLRKKIHLVLRGTVYSGFENSKFRYDLKNFFWSYRLEGIDPNSLFRKIISNDLKLMMSDRNWIIEETNDIVDVPQIAENYVEVTLSYIAIALCNSKDHIEQAALLIEKLLPFLEKRIPPEKRKIYINKEKTQVKISINLLRSGRLRSILNDCYIVISRKYIDEKKFDEAERILNYLLEHGGDIIDCYSNLALLSFYKNDIKSAEDYTDEIGKINKYNTIYYVNKAFFYILRMEYKGAMELYEELRNKIKNNEIYIISNVIIFLNDRKSENPEELAYIFAIGILTYNHIDKVNGRIILKEFINKATNRKEYSIILEKVKYILKIKE